MPESAPPDGVPIPDTLGLSRRRDPPGAERRCIIVAGADYDREASLALRDEVIALRDEALRQGDFEWSVKLSHVVAWMAVIIDKEWPE